jgi:hypothetical protein
MSGFGLQDARTVERELIAQAAHDGVTLTIENRSPGLRPRRLLFL